MRVCVSSSFKDLQEHRKEVFQAIRSLAAATHSFEECWDRPVSGLGEDATARRQTEVGFDPGGLGRLEEAVELYRVGLEALRLAGRLRHAANAAGKG